MRIYGLAFSLLFSLQAFAGVDVRCQLTDEEGKSGGSITLELGESNLEILEGNGERERFSTGTSFLGQSVMEYTSFNAPFTGASNIRFSGEVVKDLFYKGVARPYRFEGQYFRHENENPVGAHFSLDCVVE